jgi:multicomponent Na+:H+ antiporter subunit G
MGKCDTVGVALVMAGLAIHEGWTLTSLKLLAVGAFIFLAGPLATHALGRAALRAGLKPYVKEPR